MSSIVIALGGNALGNTPYQQLELIRETAKPIADLIERGEQVTVVHGNGPQVGMINLGLSAAAESGAIKSDMPFPECGAMSQGYIGYHLQNAISNELKDRAIEKNVATVVTQVVVDSGDKAFLNPTKPVGSYYTQAQAEEIQQQKGFVFKEDSGRGWRRVVPSPIPVDVVEKDVIDGLVKSGVVVIAAGGGGIPVVKNTQGHYEGVAAVIDKDYAAEKLGELINADVMIILTAVEAVCINFGKPDQKALRRVSPDQLSVYCKEGQFAPGSMLPKVEAAGKFARSRTGRMAIIASLQDAVKAIEGNAGTIISN